MAEDNVKAQMRKGILEYCILAILSREDSYAPKIIAELKRAEMIVVEGTLYPILTRQKNAGLLTYRWRNPRRVRPASTTRSRTKAANTSQRSTKPGMNSSDRSNSSATEKTINPQKTKP